MLGVAITLAPARRAGASVAPPPPAPPAPATLPVTPTARWHPAFSAVVESAGRVVSASDLMGLAGVTAGGAGIGPLAMTDALGRKFWRFEGAQFLNVATSLVFANTRETTVFLVGRIHRTSFNTRLFSGGSVVAGTAGNGAALLDARVALNGEAAFVGNARAAASGKANMVPGTQLQVIGQLRRTTGNGGDQVWLNRKTCVIGTQGSGTLNVAGGEIGRYSFGPGTSGNWGQFDLYEMIVWDARITPAQAQAVAEALADAYAIPEITNQLVLEGDSITAGTGLVTSGINGAMILTDPGAGHVPATWRVFNMAVSGATVPTLTARRDTASGWPGQTLPGQNVVAVEIGRNDMAGSGLNLSAEQHYANMVAYLNTPTTGVLQRGWTVRQMANIAGGNPFNTDRIIPFRALIRDPQYLVDTQTQAGGPFAGKLSIISTDLIEDGAAGTVFLTAADAGDTTYYAGDATHPTVLGARVRVTGGTTPAYGVAAGLA